MLMFFSADWCGQCKAMHPIVEEVAKELDLEIQEVNVGSDEELAKDYEIMSIPTLLDTETGKRITGVVSAEILKERLRG